MQADQARQFQCRISESKTPQIPTKIALYAKRRFWIDAQQVARHVASSQVFYVLPPQLSIAVKRHLRPAISIEGRQWETQTNRYFRMRRMQGHVGQNEALLIHIDRPADALHLQTALLDKGRVGYVGVQYVFGVSQRVDLQEYVLQGYIVRVQGLAFAQPSRQIACAASLWESRKGLPRLQTFDIVLISVGAAYRIAQ